MSSLSTHVLDLANGGPAAGMRVELRGAALRCRAGDPCFVDSQSDAPRADDPRFDALHYPAVTQSNGRCEWAQAGICSLPAGEYELVFHAGAYFATLGQGGALPQRPTQPIPSGPLFLDQIVVRFGIAVADQHYHVPLLVSPWGYSVYRGA